MGSSHAALLLFGQEPRTFGFGPGLSLVSAIVKLHGFRLTIATAPRLRGRDSMRTSHRLNQVLDLMHAFVWRERAEHSIRMIE
ncbi:hypothetical protein V1282_006702 [Nitrobacteraceae bacterium AZCC 2146]